MIKEYFENNDCENEQWYGKYSNVCYTMDDMAEIKRNSGYIELYKNYGGEIISDCIDKNKFSEEIPNIGKPYAIFFKLRINEIKDLKSKYDYMFSKYINNTIKISTESQINKDISANDIIEIKEIESNE